MKAQNCPFCGTESQTLNLGEEQFWYPMHERRLATVGGVSLCAGLGPIVEPYVLAYTTEHFTGLSELDADLRANVFRVLDLCLQSGLFASGRLAVFEHGGSSDHTPNACLEHFHLHVVDSAYDLPPELAAAGLKLEPIAVSAQSGLAAEPGYLFAGTYDGAGSIRGSLIRKSNCGSQYLRRVLATKVGSPAWDWRACPQPEKVLHLREQWRARFGVIAKAG